MIFDFHVRLTDAKFPNLEIIITREGKPPVTISGPYDTFATKAEPALTNVIREEVQRIVAKRSQK